MSGRRWCGRVGLGCVLASWLAGVLTAGEARGDELGQGWTIQTSSLSSSGYTFCLDDHGGFAPPFAAPLPAYFLWTGCIEWDPSPVDQSWRVDMSEALALVQTTAQQGLLEGWFAAQRDKVGEVTAALEQVRGAVSAYQARLTTLRGALEQRFAEVPLALVRDQAAYDELQARLKEDLKTVFEPVQQ